MSQNIAQSIQNMSRLALITRIGMTRQTLAAWRPPAAQALAKEGNTLLLPAAMNDPAGMVAQAMSIYGTVSKQQGFGGGGGNRWRSLPLA